MNRESINKLVEYMKNPSVKLDEAQRLLFDEFKSDAQKHYQNGWEDHNYIAGRLKKLRSRIGQEIKYVEEMEIPNPFEQPKLKLPILYDTYIKLTNDDYKKVQDLVNGDELLDTDNTEQSVMVFNIEEQIISDRKYISLKLAPLICNSRK